jgi:phage-related protein
VNLLDLMIKVGVDDQASSGLDKIVGNVKNVVSTIGSGLAAAAKVGTAAVTAAAGGVAALTTAAVNSFADYEQLVGGVETLFKDAAGAVQSYADEAFRTAGLSANEYMETVTSFSASLLQSLDNDTAAAADAAQEAIVDMADNANKMGTSMALVQDAYQAFAKQNFSTLDNLKLGYGGTQKEMYRLMQTAAELDETFAKTAEFSLDEKGHLAAEFADITKAIHIVQTEMGITGTTAQEAASTISGSVASMKAAWRNMLTALADDNADFGASIDALVVSADTAFANLVPRIEQSLMGIAQFVEEVAPVVIEAIPGIVETVLPSMLSALEAVGKAAVGAVREIAGNLITTISEVFYEFTGIDLSPLLDSLSSVASLIRDTLGGMLDGVDLAGIGAVVNGFLTTLAGAVSAVVSAVQGESFQNFVSALMGMLTTIGGSLVSALKPAADGIKELFLSFLSGDSGVIQSIADAFGSFAEWFENSLAPIIGNVASSVVELLKPFVDGISVIIVAIADALGKLFVWFDPTRSEAAKKLSEAVVRIIGTFQEGLSDIIEKVALAIEKFITAITNDEGAVEWFADIIGVLADNFARSVGYAFDLAGKIGDLIVSVSDLDTNFKEVFGGLGEIIGTAVGQIAEELDRMIRTMAEKFGSLKTILWESTGIGQIFTLFDSERMQEKIGNATDMLSNFGEGVWDYLTKGTDAALDVHRKAQIEAHGEVITKNVPYGESTAARVTEEAVNAVIQSYQQGGGKTANINLNVDGRTVASAVYDPLNDIIRQKGAK